MNEKPVETIIIQRNDSHMVIKIPPTTAEHNMIIALLQRIRHDFPGAWYCAQQWERKEFPRRIGEADESIPLGVPVATQQVMGRMKEVSREHLGLPPEDPIMDVPV